MNLHITESIWLNEQGVCRIEQLAEYSGLSIAEIADLIEVGLIEPVDPRAQPHTFQLRHIVTVKTAHRLREDFQLDRHGVALALTLLRRVDELEDQVKALKAQLR
jgi:chaperone modulatory protein CbpM